MYSRSYIESLYDKYAQAAVEINENRINQNFDANIIFIMSESFSDPEKVEGFTYNEDPIPYTRELLDNTLSGQSLAQNIGGGTANSEFEALTGLSMEPMKVYSPFTQAADIMSRVPSLVSRANRSGLETTAIHAYNPRLYKRSVVYSEMGFDNFIHEETMKYTDKIENNEYISDESAFNEIIHTMNSTNSKDFIHLVTMQNHMSYRDNYGNVDYNSSGAWRYDEGNGYLQGLNYSDKALENFIDYIEQYDEEVLIVFWGDHLPSIYTEEVEKQNDALTLRETPLFFYSNQHELSGDAGTISPIYYANHILEIFDMKVTPFDVLKMELENVLPGIYGGLYLESVREEPVSSRDELTESTYNLLNEFIQIQYDITTGNNYANELGFFELTD